jgi:hypothetical protein
VCDPSNGHDSTSSVYGFAPWTAAAMSSSSFLAEMMTVTEAMSGARWYHAAGGRGATQLPPSRRAFRTRRIGISGSGLGRLAVGLWWVWAIGIHALALWALLEAGFRF